MQYAEYVSTVGRYNKWDEDTNMYNRDLPYQGNEKVTNFEGRW